MRTTDKSSDRLLKLLALRARYEHLEKPRAHPPGPRPSSPAAPPGAVAPQADPAPRSARPWVSAAKRLLPLTVGLALLAAILAGVDLIRLAAAFDGARWSWYLAAQGATLAYILLVSRRWQALLGLQGLEYAFREVFLIYNAGALAGAVTPGRLGDLARLVYFPRQAGVLIPVTLSILADRLLDLAALVGLGLLALGCLPLPAPGRQAVIGVAVFGLLTVATLLVGFWRRGRRLPALILRLLPVAWQPRLEAGIQEFWQALPRYRTWRLSFPGLLTLLAWGANVAGAYFIARSLEIPLSLGQTAAILGLATLFTLIPVTFAGLGTRELSCIFLFSLLGLPREPALAFSLLLFGLVLTHAALGWLCLTLKPPGRGKEITPG